MSSTTTANRNEARRDAERGIAWLRREVNIDADVYRVRNVSAKLAKRIAAKSVCHEETRGPWNVKRFASNDETVVAIIHASKSATLQRWLIIEAV